MRSILHLRRATAAVSLSARLSWRMADAQRGAAALTPRLLVLAAMLALPAACASPPAGSLAAVTTLIGDAACSDDSQCRTVAIGAKACGGPEAYLAWSVLRTDAQALDAAAAAYNRARVAEGAQSGRVSNCALVADPGASCQSDAGVRACRLLRAGQGSGAGAQ